MSNSDGLSSVDSSAGSIMLLLGRRDTPTDGIENDSNCLAAALRERGFNVRVARYEWKELGFVRASRALRAELRREKAKWVILQYTPLSWGPRGFAFGAMLAARVARSCGSGFAVDIHDVLPSTGPRLYDRVRERLQKIVMRSLVRRSGRVFVHVDPAHAPWAREIERRRMTILPTGTAIPPDPAARPKDDGKFTVVVFGLTGHSESADADTIVTVLHDVGKSVADLRLLLVGRGADLRGPGIRRGLEADAVEVGYEGVVPESRVSEVLSRGDVFLFLRSGVSSRRSTVVAALAHGLPIVGYRGDETGWPVTEAGLALADHGDAEGVTRLVIEIAHDSKRREELSKRSRTAFDKYFSWDRIADVVEASLQPVEVSSGTS